jgi:hypothetical protein
MKALVYGNGESRKVWDVTKKYEGFTTWGCNAIHRDCVVDNLVGIDYAIQQEIYKSGYAINNKCHFADWAILDSFDPEFMKENFSSENIFETPKRNNNSGYGWYDRTKCVVQGKDNAEAESNYARIHNKFPGMDEKDLKTKCYKDVGLYITWIEDKDKVEDIDFPRNWSAGTTAIHLACQEGADEVYMLGFDLSNSNKPINNVYKGTDHYLPNDSKGFNPVNWTSQLETIFDEFHEVKFTWVVNNDFISPTSRNNVHYMFYKDLDKLCQA